MREETSQEDSDLLESKLIVVGRNQRKTILLKLLERIALSSPMINLAESYENKFENQIKYLLQNIDFTRPLNNFYLGKSGKISKRDDSLYQRKKGNMKNYTSGFDKR